MSRTDDIVVLIVLTAPISSCYHHLPFRLPFNVRQLVVRLNFLDIPVHCSWDWHFAVVVFGAGHIIYPNAIYSFRRLILFLATFSPLLATITPSSSQNSNLSPSTSPPRWLVEIHSKLWGRRDLFGDIFRTANLTEADFIELQSHLQELNPERNSESYEAKDVLAAKSAFLRSKSTPLSDTNLGIGLVPRLVFDASYSPSPCVVDGPDDTDDADAVADDTNAVADDAMDIDPDPGSSGSSQVNTDAVYLNGIFPCTIGYMDLTVLRLENEIRVPPLTLLRKEWGDMIDIFNGRKRGIRGSALFTGQPGIGEYDYHHLIHTSNQ